jgi:predicted transcriptional regulator
MKTLSLKLDDAVFEDTETVCEQIKKTRNRYINEALHFYNRMQKRRLLALQLGLESQLVSDESMLVLQEFESFEEDAQKGWSRNLEKYPEKSFGRYMKTSF